jgi:hypothetical protein
MLQAHPKSATISQFFLITGTLLVWFALIAQFYLIIINRTASVPETIVRFFSFFTILSNIMVALCFTLPLVRPHSSLARFFSKPSVAAAVALYIGVTCVIYNTILRPLADFNGLQLVVDELLHLIDPIWFLAYWLLLVPKASLAWKNLGPWMIFPAVYCVYSLVRGAMVGYYPYPFFNAGRLGYQQVLINCGGMVLLFEVTAIALIAIARRMAR